MLTVGRSGFALVCVAAFTSPCFAVTVSPSSATVQEHATQQFTASTPSTWTTNCGSISSTGLFNAPLYPKLCTVTALAINGTGSATASVNVISPITMTPIAATTPQGGTQQFTASAPVTWIAACGSITPTGLFTASGSVGQYCTIEGIAITSPKYTVYGYDRIGSPTSPPPFSISPLNPTITEGATLQFTAGGNATFSASCGTISSTGLYTAPLIPATCTITATAKSGAGAANTSANIRSPITITPPSATTPQGQTQQFTANAPVTWTATCGSMGPTGLFTASGTVGSTCTIEAIATDAPPYTAFGSDTISSSSATFSISPPNPTVFENATQQFTAGNGATWATDCGSISSTGLFKAPLYPKLCTISATTTSPAQTAKTSANVTSPVTMVPSAATTPQGQTQQFTASAPVTWTAACGSITASGLFTASAPVGKYCTVQGTASAGPKYTVYGYDKIASPSAKIFSISPVNPSLTVGTTLQFTASAGAAFAATCGTISPSGLYTAPSVAESCTISATATDGSGQVAFSTATMYSGATISPATASLFALGKLQFTASPPSTWSASCGSIDAITGLFTAPASATNCTVTATSKSDPVSTATAGVTVSVINYTTFRGSTDRKGAQTQERVLTPSNVNSSTFGLAWSLKLDAGIWSQPLYMNGITINGVAHNVVFETTANDSVYAVDADNGSLLWQRSFLSPVVTAVAGSAIGSPMNPVGIVGTPVIDPDDNALYVVAMTAENNNTTFIHRLHAIDITTGAELPNSPVDFSFPGFVDTQQMQRAALLLANSHVYVSFGGIGDRPPYQGWLFAFHTNTLALDSVFDGSPNSDSTGGAGIWMSGSGPAADPDGNIYVTTGNGYADDLNNFGQSVLKLSPDLDVLDYFTPFNHAAQSASDLDLGSGGVLVVPDQTSGPFLHELIVCGKPTPIYVLNRDQLGGVDSSSDNIVQRLDGQLAQTGSFRDSGIPCFSTPAMWKQNVYFIANHDVIKMFTLDSGKGLLSTAPVSKGSTIYSWPGAYPVISANGDSNGIVWAYELSSGTLRATDANNVANELFVGAVLPSSKWSVPTVINGHVYIGTQNSIFAFAPK
jgi:PQQ-like domain